MFFLKEIPQYSSHIITHLVNHIIRSKQFPNDLKCSKIVPILKSGKESTEKASYRPINNLEVVEKVVEEVLKTQLVQSFEENEIIHKNHHGGIRGHSTVTAKASLDMHTKKMSEQFKSSTIFCTDLTAAFDLVSHRILTLKLSHYHISDTSNDLLKSFFENRRSTVKNQSFRSKELIQPPISVFNCLN